MTASVGLPVLTPSSGMRATRRSARPARARSNADVPSRLALDGTAAAPALDHAEVTPHRPTERRGSVSAVRHLGCRTNYDCNAAALPPGTVRRRMGSPRTRRHAPAMARRAVAGADGGPADHAGDRLLGIDGFPGHGRR